MHRANTQARQKQFAGSVAMWCGSSEEALSAHWLAREGKSVEQGAPVYAARDLHSTLAGVRAAAVQQGGRLYNQAELAVLLRFEVEYEQCYPGSTF